MAKGELSEQEAAAIAEAATADPFSPQRLVELAKGREHGRATDSSDDAEWKADPGDVEGPGHREVRGCGSTTALEIDHIEDWAKTFRSKLGSLCWLCRRHHRDKTHKGWRLEGRPTSRRWVAPEKAARPPDEPGSEPPGIAADRERPTLFGDPSAA